MEDLLKSLDNSTLIFIITTIFSILVFVLGWIAKQLNSLRKTFLNEFALVKIKIGAMDHAIGKEFGNGYEGLRDKEEARLMAEHNFIKK